MNTTQALRAFCHRPSSIEDCYAVGNHCLVTVNTKPPEQAPVQSSVTHCLSWPLGKQRAGVSCWTSEGLKIECCGHGLLCCAAIWVNHWGQEGTLVMNATEIQCRVADEQVWLGFESLPLQNCEIPSWCEQYFDVQPTAAANAGASQGYLVLQWPKNFDITSLTRPDASLAKHTARSLIVTCAVGRARAQLAEDIQYRYFAPQYGVVEDAATGSAMRVLASFWQQGGLGASLTAYQCSDEGGLLFSRIENGSVWVGGKITTVARESVNIE